MPEWRLHRDLTGEITADKYLQPLLRRPPLPGHATFPDLSRSRLAEYLFGKRTIVFSQTANKATLYFRQGYPTQSHSHKLLSPPYYSRKHWLRQLLDPRASLIYNQ